jgi:hypothetical protein
VVGHDGAHGLLVGEVRGDLLHLGASLAQGVRSLLERLRLAGGHGDPVALVCEDLGQREPDAS